MDPSGSSHPGGSLCGRHRRARDHHAGRRFHRTQRGVAFSRFGLGMGRNNGDFMENHGGLDESPFFDFMDLFKNEFNCFQQHK